jgi:hypothetical protein
MQALSLVFWEMFEKYLSFILSSIFLHPLFVCLFLSLFIFPSSERERRKCVN